MSSARGASVVLEVDVGAEEVNGFLTGILGGILGLVVDGLDVVVDVLVLDELATGTGESESSRAVISLVRSLW